MRIGHRRSFQIRNEQFSARSKKSRGRAETYRLHVAQTTPRTDAEIAEKGHFWMETSSFFGHVRGGLFAGLVIAGSLITGLDLFRNPTPAVSPRGALRAEARGTCGTAQPAEAPVLLRQGFRGHPHSSMVRRLWLPAKAGEHRHAHSL